VIRFQIAATVTPISSLLDFSDLNEIIQKEFPIGGFLR